MESKTVEKTRPVTITAASLAFIIFGAVSIVVAVLLGIAFSSIDSIFGIGIFIAVGIVFLIAIIGVLDMVAGYGLWHMRRWASIMGMLLGILGLIIQNFYYFLLFAATPYPSSIYSALSTGAGSSLIDVILIVLIAISWKSFEPSTT